MCVCVGAFVFLYMLVCVFGLVLVFFPESLSEFATTKHVKKVMEEVGSVRQ